MKLREKLKQLKDKLLQLEDEYTLLENHVEKEDYQKSVDELTKGQERKTLELTFELAETKSLEEGKGLIVKGIASSDVIDRMGDIVSQDKIKFSKYNSGYLPVPFNHNLNQIIGGAPINKQYVLNNKLHFEAIIREPANDIEKPIFENIKQGFISAISIGFLVKTMHYEGDIAVFDEIEIYEISIVTVPANQDALIESVELQKQKSISDETLNPPKTDEHSSDKGEGEIKAENPTAEEVASLKAEIESLKTQLQDANAQIEELDSLTGELASAIEEKTKGITNEK